MSVFLQIGPRPPEPEREPESGPDSTPPGLPAETRVFRSSHGAHLFVADGSRIYDLPEATAARLEAWTAAAARRPTTRLRTPPSPPNWDCPCGAGRESPPRASTAPRPRYPRSPPSRST